MPILVAKPEANPAYADYAKKRGTYLAEMRAMIDKLSGDLRNTFQTNAGAYLLWNQFEGTAKSDFAGKMRLDIQNTGQRVRGAVRRDPNDPIFGPWTQFARLSKEEFPKQAKALALKIGAEEGSAAKGVKGKGAKSGKYNPIVARAFKNASPASLNDVASIYTSIFASVRVSNQRLVDKDINALWQMPFPAPQASQIDEADFGEIIGRFPLQYQGRFTPIRAKIVQLDMEHAGSPPRAMVMQDRSRAEDSPVFIRGEVQNRGEIVPRRYLEIIAGESRAPFRNGSGRLELAQSIATKSNPLTARVMVNRIWLHHFGEGFVTSPDDFGLQSAPPSHPELLDYLATAFVENGWSVKKMHRLIMLSSTYQQSSENNPRFAQIDPNNRLLWRANIRRLEFEALRDSLLAIGGRLDLRMFGKPVELNKEPYSPRRTVYGMIDRGNIPEVLNHFDFANPSLSTGKRYDTIVPQQALFFMNSPLVVEQARNLVSRPDFRGQQDIEAAITLLYELIYQRQPKSAELKMGMDFLATSPLPNRAVPAQQNNSAKGAPKAAPERRGLSKWESYAHALLLANETSYVN
ncbi:MAG: DUF1553 domain-containing protein [Verrucomicrobia bacterium]|nr:DUF1553 domain-containing protein [Verrucomicrobiota bacterium]